MTQTKSVRKDYRHGNEFKILKESSLGKMNTIESKIKLSGFLLFQPSLLEHTLVKLFQSVFLSYLFLGLSDPQSNVS